MGNNTNIKRLENLNNLESAWETSYLSGGNMSYIDALYEDYCKDPDSVSSDWKALFRELGLSETEVKRGVLTSIPSVSANGKQAEVANLITAYRTYGHLAAQLDPLDLTERPGSQNLEETYYGLNDTDFNRPFFVGGIFGHEKMTLADLKQRLQKTYCGSIGIEYMHIADAEVVEWIQQHIETWNGRSKFSAQKKRTILQDLVAAEGLERYLGTRFAGQKRFSLEGGESLVPMLKALINNAGGLGVAEMVVGMAHRGRLNILVNVLGKSPHELFQEFEGRKSDAERTGDVKYHLGFSSDLRTYKDAVIHVALAFNPSHLEIIGPVVEGSARSRLRKRDDLEKKNCVVPVVIHGDAAFAGQGVIMETLNFSQARGYCTGGTVHIVINNQIGFTTSSPLDARSTLYCTDVAKMVQAPILHVNGDDPEAVVFATEMALAFRMKFKQDVVLDLVCYRRHGHNEADEPSVTQPIMYKKIKATKPVREKYEKQLIQEGVLTHAMVEEWVTTYRDKLDRGESVIEIVQGDYEGKMITDWSSFWKAKWTDKVVTAVPLDKLQALSDKLLHNLPKGFKPHPVVQKLIAEREKMTLGEIPLNWGYAEAMAFATLLDEGCGVRLSGQDSARGTFAHRHTVIHDNETDKTFTPLEHVASDLMYGFSVIDSILSEEAVLAFEYGFAASEPNMLVIWEAQFGDFANGAQVVIDQFISSGEQKWGRLCGLVMFLPHGYEGQGPEHSSARLERYMQLCAEQNIQVCVPTTPAQIFHLLRRQIIRKFRKPLIIMTPKSLLRHKLAVSKLEDLTSGKFQNVISEIDDDINPNEVTKIILCSGKVYYDLLKKRRDNTLNHITILRIEQLYPFPKADLVRALAVYSHAQTVVWCQEEPKNQGVWYTSQHNIIDCLRDDQELSYAGRPFAAAPAVGSMQFDSQQQKALVDQALLD